MKNVWLMLSGWKSVLAWLMLQVPGLSDYPGIVGAINDAMAHPSKEKVLNLAWQVLLTVAAMHRVKKNLS